jgi:putative transposase
MCTHCSRYLETIPSLPVKEIKRTSSSWIKEASPRQSKFHWQNGYGAFSVSQSDLSRVIS